MLVLSTEAACDICTEEYGPRRSPYCLACGHSFCAACLQGIILQASEDVCPMCRVPFYSTSIRKILTETTRDSTSSFMESTPSDLEPHIEQHPAICDECGLDGIKQTRYKCAMCPDYDVCPNCFESSHRTHPGHIFIRIRSTEDYILSTIKERPPPTPHGVSCTSCSQAIEGIRYKCSHPNCPTINLCQTCESMPIPRHPREHPLLKIYHPVTFSGIASFDTTQRHCAYCDWCNRPIFGSRFKCMNCDDYDHCELCEQDPVPKHPSSHFMLKIRSADAMVPAPFLLKP